METLLFALWFFWPAGSANSAPILANNTPLKKYWNTPLDLGKSFRGHRITGDHKTWRGLSAGIVNGAIIGLVQLLIARNFEYFAELGSIDYTDASVILLGAVLGIGALLGDAVKSFFKRQVGVPSGSSWFPFDQIDYIVGGLLFSLLFVRLELAEYITVFVLFLILHPAVSFLGWALKMRPWPF